MNSNRTQMPQYRGGQPAPAPKQPPAQPKKKKSGLMGRVLRRFFLVLFTLIVLILAGLILILNMIFNGPSIAAQEVLTMTLIEASATKWVPALFIGEERVAEIMTTVNAPLTDDVTNTSQVVINRGSSSSSSTDEWANYPDGIRFEEHRGKTYTAHIMIVKDPSQVYLGQSYYDGFSLNKLGKRANEIIEEEGALAVVNGGAFNDDGTGAASNGSLPQGVSISKGTCYWETGAPPANLQKSGGYGFAGFNEDDVLVVAKGNVTKAQAEEWNIRDGVSFGPVLIMNGEVNGEAYNVKSGWNPRSAIGQRADGSVVFVCIDGRQPGSMGGEYSDLIDIMIEYDVVNACNLDGGSSAIMMYRDTYGRYGEPGEVTAINSYSLLQDKPRRMPNFWMVRPAE